MRPLARIIVVGAICFLAGSLGTAATIGHVDNDDISFPDLECAGEHDCSQSYVPLDRASPLPSMGPYETSCQSYDQPHDTNLARAGRSKMSLFGVPINIANRAFIGLSPGALAAIKKHPLSKRIAHINVNEPYIFVVVERCTKWDQAPKKRITTQILRIPYNTNGMQAPTIETRRTNQ